MKAEKGLPEAARQTVSDLNRLVKLEVQLVAEQVKARALKKAVSAGAGAGGAFFLITGILFLLAAGAAGLALVLPWWAALLLVGGACLVFAVTLGVGAMVGMRRSSPIVPDETRQQVKEDVRWLREQKT
jgi:hypothetical protein